jgi:hypothetical protein
MTIKAKRLEELVTSTGLPAPTILRLVADGVIR